MATVLESIQGIIGKVLPPLMSLSSATIHVYTAGDLNTPETFTDYVVPNLGFVDSDQIDLRQVGALEPNERAVLIYVAQLPPALVTADAATGLLSSTLKPDDEITIGGSRAKLVRRASQDPAQATQIWAVVDS